MAFSSWCTEWLGPGPWAGLTFLSFLSLEFLGSVPEDLGQISCVSLGLDGLNPLLP